MLKMITLLAIIIILIGSGLYITGFIGNYKNEMKLENEKIVIQSKNTEPLEKNQLLIFISPQYANNQEILNSINNYITAVKNDIDWDVEIIKLTNTNNDFKEIDIIIEGYKPEAVIMVGEDIDTALAAEFENIEQPSAVPWSTLGGENSYHILEESDFDSNQEHGPLEGKSILYDRPYKIDVLVSFIYPVSTLSYDERSNQIISLFNRFSTGRNKNYGNMINVFVDYFCTDMNDPYCMDMRRIESFRKLNKFGELSITEDEMTTQDVLNTYDMKYKAFFVDGHGNPSTSFQFTYNDIIKIDSPFVSVAGCNVAAWYSDYQEPNGLLDPPKSGGWFGDAIFHNQNIRVIYQNPAEAKEIYQFSNIAQQDLIEYYGSDKIGLDNFMYNGTEDFFGGKTITESVIGRIYSTEQFIFGDPTFHY